MKSNRGNGLAEILT